MTDREKLTEHIERVCAITGKMVIEHDRSLEVVGGPTYRWTDDGQIKSIVKDGQSYGPEGKRRK
jgi:hypothetical protein